MDNKLHEKMLDILRQRAITDSADREWLTGEMTALFQTELAARQNELLDAVVADAPKDRNHPHKMFSSDLVEAYADGYDKANAQWREVIQRHGVQDRVQES